MQQEIPFDDKTHLGQLKLSRPLALFDLETTGIDKKNDRIVEIAILKVFPDGHEEQFYSLVNPERPIPPEATQVHGIDDARVRHQPNFASLAEKIFHFLADCDLGGFNCYRFDIPILLAEFERCSLFFPIEERHIIDVMVIYHRLRPRNLENAYREFCGKELQNAHSAMADIRATLEVLQAQISQTPELPNTAEELQKYCQLPMLFDPMGKIIIDNQGNILFNFGKYKGQKITELLVTDPDYLRWFLTSDISNQVRQKILLKHPELSEIYAG